MYSKPNYNTQENPQKSEALSYLGTTTKFASPLAIEICNKYWLQALSRKLLPNKRIQVCNRVLKPHARQVEIMKHVSKPNATFRGLMRCSSVWDCPVCALSITEKRRREIQLAMAKSIFDPAMITYTLQHKKSEPLRTVFDRLHKAYRSLKSGKVAVRIKNDYRWVGSIRAFEITHGKHGWHPHYHELMFSEYLPATHRTRLESELRMIWIQRLKRQGAWGNGASLNIVDGQSQTVAEYISKYGHMPTRPIWDSAAELTKQPTKRAKRSMTKKEEKEQSRTPLQLLANYGEGDTAAGDLFIEYSEVVHGKQQLVWSRGLRDLFDMEDYQTDEEIADGEADSDEFELLTTLDLEQWRRVRDYNLQAQVLVIAVTGDVKAIHEFIDNYNP